MGSDANLKAMALGRRYETMSYFRSSNMGLTLYDKLWDSHVVHLEDDGTALLYIDRHLVHEVTSPQGAFACLAHGIGTSEVEHVLATQCLVTRKMKNMRVSVEGALARGVTAKDVVLAVIGRIGTAGGTGHAIEFAGSTIRALSMEGRMTICNMSIEAGPRAGKVAAGETTIEYGKGRPVAPRGAEQERAAS